MSDSIFEYLTAALTNAKEAAFGDSARSIDIVIEKPKQKAYGDFSTPVALSLAKSLKANPMAVAKQLMEQFVWDDRFVVPDPALAKTITGGFINFRLANHYLDNVLKTAVLSPESVGRNQTRNPKRMLLEFVSANPTGPMVVVNGRAAAIGDTIARVNLWIGNIVDREYYVNDFGNQVELLGESIAVRYYQGKGIDGVIPEGGYEGDYVAELAAEISEKHPEVAAMSRQDAATFFMQQALILMISRQQAILEKYGVKYDQWFRESSLHASGAPKKTLALLSSKGLTYESEGAIWFKSTQFGDEKDRVLVRKEGTPTYFLADLSYHMVKASRGYDMSFTFWGPDHHGYLPRLEGAVNALDLTNTVFKNFIIQQVNLIRDGQPFKMSKRKGDFVTMADLLDEVGVDAMRYFFLMRRLSSHFDFDIGLAKKQSDENPVFYVQYAHARTCSLLGHGEQQGFSAAEIQSANPSLLSTPEEQDLIKRIADFPTVLMQTATFIETQRITTFLETFAAEFHSFYQKHRIVTENRDLSCARLLLTTGVRNILKLGLDLLGVSAPQRM